MTVATKLGGRYRLISEIGRGGIGVVWRAHDENLGREVAVKVLHGWVAEDEEARHRFKREATLLAKVEHPNIVRLYDYEETGSTSFLVMELIDGGNLAQETDGRRPLKWEAVRRYAVPVCEALAYAHAKGIVHRDLSPTNILVQAPGRRVLVSDFGLARLARTGESLTSTGVLIGKPEYWAPEQARGERTTPATDLYALGCILFELLSGRLPFDGEDRLAAGMQRVFKEAPTLDTVSKDVPESAVTLVSRLLERKAEDRPHAAEVAVSITAERSGGPSAPATPLTRRRSRPTEPPTRQLTKPASTVTAPTPRPSRSRRWWIALATVGLLAAGGVTAGGLIAFLSGSGETRVVPRLTGLTLAQARVELTRASQATDSRAPPLLVTNRQYSERYDEGRITSQSPKTGEELDPPASVRVVLSRGSAWEEVPAIPSGSSFVSAEARLALSGFDAERRYRPSQTVGRNRVLATRPVAGTRAHRPASVLVVLSSGVPRAAVPAVRGKPLAVATQQLVARGFHYSTSYEENALTQPGLVLRQSPSPGSSVPAGSVVELVVAREPAPPPAPPPSAAGGSTTGRAARWHEVLAHSGSSTYKSPALNVPQRWRIRYTVLPADAFSIGASFTITGGEGGFGYDSFRVDQGSDYYYPDVGRGEVQIRVDPDSATFSIIVEVFS